MPAAREAHVVPESTPEEVAAADAARPATAEDALEANRVEYGQYVASQRILIGTALAYNPGDAVPASNVHANKNGEANQVVKVGSKGHNDLRAALGLPPLKS